MTDSVQHQRQLTFNEDGTIDPSQLEGMDQATIDRLTAPDFVAMARQQIAANKARESFRRGALQIKARARQEHEARRPSGISGRQRKRLRRAARKMPMLGFKAKQEEFSHVPVRELPEYESSRVS